jgi:hypothetical protein
MARPETTPTSRLKSLVKAALLKSACATCGAHPPQRSTTEDGKYIQRGFGCKLGIRQTNLMGHTSGDDRFAHLTTMFVNDSKLEKIPALGSLFPFLSNRDNHGIIRRRPSG